MGGYRRIDKTWNWNIYHLCHGLALCGARGSHLKNKPPKHPKSKTPKPKP